MSDFALTELLNQVDSDPHMRDRVIAQVYDTLKSMARGQMAKEAAGHTLTPTALVNEAYLRLLGNQSTWEHRRHFFGAAAEAMRRILIDHARRRSAQRRGGDWLPITAEMDAMVGDPGDDPAALLALDEHMSELENMDPECAEVVKLRFYGGFEFREIAEIVGVSERTVMRRWRTARAWIGTRLQV